MTLSLLLVASSGLGDESCQDVDGEVCVFLVEGLPGIGLVEEKIEEASIFFLHWRSPWLWLKFRPRWSRQRDGRGEHRRELVRAASLPGNRELLRQCTNGLCGRSQVGPISRNQRFAAIGQDQDEKETTFAVHRPENVERAAFERMANTDNSDRLGKMLMMGSVS